MAILDRFRGADQRAAMLERKLAAAAKRIREAEVGETIADLRLEETITELQLAIEDIGWQRLNMQAKYEFTRDGLDRIVETSRTMFIKNPLIRRSVMVQSYYVFGQGVQIKANDERVDEVVQRWWDDRGNRDAFTAHQARMANEQTLQHDGNVVLAHFVSDQDGSVRTRPMNIDEVRDIVTSPDDRWDRWYYKRVWAGRKVNLETGFLDEFVNAEAFYPDWRVYFDGPAGFTREGSNAWPHPTLIAGKRVEKAALMHLRVGGTQWMEFGIPDVYAALDWALAYKRFLEDCASIFRSLARFAWQVTQKGGKAKRVAARQRLETTISEDGGETNPPPVTGATFIGDEDTKVMPINKSGASISPEDGRMLRLMVAAATDMPDTFLSNDPQQGALATAKTLDRPTELAMRDRQMLWSDLYRDCADFAVDADLRSRAGLLPTAKDSTNAAGKVVAIDKKTGEPIDRTVEVNFPPILEQDRVAIIEAIVKAATLDGKNEASTLPEDLLRRLLLVALEVEDVDTLVEEMAKDRSEMGVQTGEDERGEMVEALRAIRRTILEAADPQRIVVREQGAAQAAAEGGVMVAWIVPPELAAELAVPGGEQAEELHLTLAYMGTRLELGPFDVERLTATVKVWAATERPLSGSFAGVGRFVASEGTEEPVLALVDVPGLDLMRARLIQALRREGLWPVSNHGFTPHVTLAWVSPSDPMPVESVPAFPIAVDRVAVVVGGERFVYPMRQLPDYDVEGASVPAS